MIRKKIKKVLAIIPARLDSKRLPGKMLRNMNGKPLLRRSYEQVLKAKLPTKVIIATDSKIIAKAAKSWGAEVIMTSSRPRNGTERVYEALKKFKGFTPDIVVNIWGDEPLLSPKAIDASIELVLKDPKLNIASAVSPVSEKLAKLPSIVKPIFDLENNLLYLSRSLVPYPYTDKGQTKYYQILGTVAMRPGFFHWYMKTPQTPLELREGVEQFRIIEHGHKMRVALGDFEGMGVNTPKEFRIVLKMIQKKEGKKKK